ncbi:hypothetical protein JFU49_02095 [Pseudomonas sp. TH03]|nr:DUF6124 family protein [Pseudomonas sp. TH03]MBK5549081.1 hypothetical protein [Pseudomonas sp. TH03]
MKKNDPDSTENPIATVSEDLGPTRVSNVTRIDRGARLRTPKKSVPVSKIFKVAPDVDTITLLAHASENLALLSVMTSKLATQLDSPHRNVVLAIQQLAGLAEILINRALENLDYPQSPIKPVCH